MASNQKNTAIKCYATYKKRLIFKQLKTITIGKYEAKKISDRSKIFRIGH